MVKEPGLETGSPVSTRSNLHSNNDGESGRATRAGCGTSTKFHKCSTLRPSYPIYLGVLTPQGPSARSWGCCGHPCLHLETPFCPHLPLHWKSSRDRLWTAPDRHTQHPLGLPGPSFPQSGEVRGRAARPGGQRRGRVGRRACEEMEADTAQGREGQGQHSHRGLHPYCLVSPHLHPTPHKREGQALISPVVVPVAERSHRNGEGLPDWV